jgi:serine/threonine protein kinase
VLQPNQRLGDFVIVRLLGRGGMGEVYEARQHNPQRSVALKVLPPWLASNPDAVERFEREANALARLDHPGIVRIFTTGRTEDTFWFSMQLVRGVSLARLIHDASQVASSSVATVFVGAEKDTPVGTIPTVRSEAPAPQLGDDTPAEVVRGYREDRFGFTVRAGIAMARALGAAHREKVLHRDLKPGNVMLSRDGDLYLMDFGLARLLDPDEGTTGGAVKGTLWYMSPEQARGEPLDERSDLYSLGVTLYELASVGACPFAVNRGDRRVVLEAVRTGAIRPLHEVAAGVPARLAHVIEKATRLRPEERYRSAGELLAELRGDGAARPSSTVPQTSPPVARPVAAPRRRWSAILALAAAGLALAVLAWSAPWKNPPEHPGPGPKEPPQTEEDFWPFDPNERLPKHLEQRALNVGLPLLNDRGEPTWFWKVCGDGRYQKVPPMGPVPARLRLIGLVDRIVALVDYDRSRNWFRLTAELSEAGVDALKESGILFGYRRNPHDPEARSPFFVVRIVEAREGRPPRLQAGFSYIDEPRGDRQSFESWNQSLPGVPRDVGVPAASPQGWRHLEIWCVEDRLVITVDRDPAARLEINLPALRKALPDGTDLDPRGGVGLWAHRCLFEVRDLKITALPPGTAGP